MTRHVSRKTSHRESEKFSLWSEIAEAYRCCPLRNRSAVVAKDLVIRRSPGRITRIPYIEVSRYSVRENLEAKQESSRSCSRINRLLRPTIFGTCECFSIPAARRWWRPSIETQSSVPALFQRELFATLQSLAPASSARTLLRNAN
jgi:hypothetical protein